MKITLQKAYDLLQDCAAIITDSVVLYPSLGDLTGPANNEFLLISWNNEGEEYNRYFDEGANKEVEIVGSSMFLMDTEGEVNQISLLNNWDIENENNELTVIK